MKINIKVRTKWNTVDGEKLIKAFKLTKTPDILKLFLDDLLTEKEINLCIRRLQAADMLRIGTPYSFVRNSTGLSPNTIAQISKKMRNRRGGYSEILERIHPNGIRYFD